LPYLQKFVTEVTVAIKWFQGLSNTQKKWIVILAAAAAAVAALVAALPA
jgi:hypothetical protein